MSEPNQSPEEVTQQLPRISPRPSDTAPLYPPSELDKLQEFMQQRQQTPPPPPSRRGWMVKALGLAGVALVSGLVWWAVQSGGSGTTATPVSTAPVGEFTFTAAEQVPEPLRDSNCAEHAYGETKNFLARTPCQQLTRAMYTTKLPDGRSVYTSVSVVRMKSADDALKLKELTARNGTGNVNDLVKAKVVKVTGLDSLGNGGYYSEHRDREVVIVESDTPSRGSDKAAHTAEMKRVSKDALRLASSLE